MRWSPWVGLALGLLLAAPAGAVDEARVKAAIERGVAALRRLQVENGSFFNRQGPPGATALAGLTLLEAGVSSNDPQIRRAADYVRKSSVELDQTYGLSMSILFLDRLGDPRDDYIIQVLALRLLRGQQRDACWGYQCPVSEQEREALTAHLRESRPGSGQRGPGATPSLPEDVRSGLKALATQVRIDNRPDNSNTQFAVIALWVARRRGMPTEAQLVDVQKHFEATQLADGGWTYITPVSLVGATSIPGTTCAGLIGLAVGHVSHHVVLRTKNSSSGAEAPLRIGRDPHVQAGLINLAQSIGLPVPHKIVINHENRNQKYFYCVLWSIERVATAYSLKTIGGRDWYAWGAEMLLSSQEEDGTWRCDLPEGGVDTSFALLFLLRSNLVKDLSAAIKGHITDEQVALKAKTPKVPIRLGRSTGSAAARLSKLAVALLNAPQQRQAEMIGEYRDARGGEYTEALAEAIQMLEGDLKKKARDALADRLTRMSADTLRRELIDGDAEIRCAAALACGMKDDKSFTPDLIPHLFDDDQRVERAAHESLKSLTGKDFGPSPGASTDERTHAVLHWRLWWAQQTQKKR